MGRFAGLTGFDGSPEDWQEEYRVICEDSKVKPKDGIHGGLFCDLVSMKEEGGCYCDDEELRKIWASLGGGRTPLPIAAIAAPTPAAAPTQAAPTSPLGAGGASSSGRMPVSSPSPLQQASPGFDFGVPVQDMTRKQLIEEVFRYCDADRDGMLKSHEMIEFAKHIEFQGTDKEWETEFQLLCRDNQLDHTRGIPLHLFERIVSDETDAGLYCEDDTLIDFLEPRTEASCSPSPAAAQQRDALVRAVFSRCDTDGDSLLSESELHTFALQTGFNGSREDWTREYQDLVHTLCKGGEPRGLHLDAFRLFVNGRETWVSDEELHGVLNAVPKNDMF